MGTEERLQALQAAVIDGQRDEALRLTEEGLGAGMAPNVLLQQGLIAGMQVVGVRFKNNEYYIPEVLVAARAMKAATELLRPLLAETDTKPVGTIAIGTVQGDLHDIGKNLVGMMLEGAGFKVVDLGVDVSPEQFGDAVEQGAELIGLSALLTTTMPSMGTTVEHLKQRALRDKVQIIIGGAPVTQQYADEVGADGFAPDAATAVDVAKALIGAA